MVNERVLGAVILVGGVAGIMLYGWLVLFSGWNLLVLQLTGFIVVTAVFAVIAWIGYTMATAPEFEPMKAVEPKIEEESKGGEGKP